MADSAVKISQDLAVTISEYATTLQYEQINENAIRMTKLDIIDTFATLVAGSSAEGIQELLEIVEEWGGKPEADIFVSGIKVPSLFAALVNGVMAHARDFDDTHDEATLHAGTSVVPAAIAAAQAVGNVSGKEFITAVNIGLDVTLSIRESLYARTYRKWLDVYFSDGLLRCYSSSRQNL